jgi:hypothetical protein
LKRSIRAAIVAALPMLAPSCHRPITGLAVPNRSYDVDSAGIGIRKVFRHAGSMLRRPTGGHLIQTDPLPGRSAVSISSRANGALGEHRRHDTDGMRLGM